MKKRVLKYILLGLLVIAVIGAGVLFYLQYKGEEQLKKLAPMSFQETLFATTKDNERAVITVGIVKDGHSDFTVYGKDAKELEKKEHLYEIGSITKTFTGGLIRDSMDQGNLNLDDTVGEILGFEGKTPTIKELLTHTSGYNGYYFEWPMVRNFIFGGNSFRGIDKEMTLSRLKKVSVYDKEHPFLYSNFGYATLGLILEKVYEKPYEEIMNEYLKSLGMTHSVMRKASDLGRTWEWEENDAYRSAGDILSTISDMLRYAELQLTDPSMASHHETLHVVKESFPRFEFLGIHMNEAASAWMKDTKNGTIFHNGATGDYNSYLGFNKEKGVAVVILSNLAPNDRVPATVMGVKLLEELTR
ncbi:serine hydrolase domain-containing protein [Guggenheimella bovis]